MPLARRATRELIRWLSSALLWTSVARAAPPTSRLEAPQIDRDCSVALASEPCPRTHVGVTTLLGAAKVPFDALGERTARGYGGDLKLHVSYTGVRPYTFGLVLPAAFARLEGDGHADRGTAIWGNPTLFVRRAEPMWLSPTRTFLATTALAVALPLAEHGAIETSHAQAFARALDAHRRPYLFLPGYLTLVPAVGLEHRIRRFGAAMQLELPLSIRAAATGLPSALTRSLALAPVLHAVGRLQTTRTLELALLTSAVFGAPPPLRVRRPARAFQFVVEPSLSLRTGAHHVLTLRGTLPLGGTLGGDALGGSVQSLVRF